MRRTILGTFLRASFLIIITGSVQGQSGKHNGAPPLEKTEWKLVWLGSTKVELGTPQQVAYIQLDPESHRVSGSGGCNRLIGGYDLAADHLKFTQIAMTRMMCLHGGDTESGFAKALNQVTSWKMAGGKLLLMDADLRILAKFVGVVPES